MSTDSSKRNQESADFYDRIMHARLKEAATGGEGVRPLELGELREYRQRLRDAGVVDASRADDSNMAELMKRAFEGGGEMPPVSREDDEAVRE